MDLLDVCRKCGLQKDSFHFIVLTRGLLAKGKECSSLSFQSKTSLDIFITLNSLKHLIGMWQEKKAVWTSWPVFLWEKPAGLKFLFFAMVIIMLEMLNSDEDKAGFRHVKMLPSLSKGSAVLWVWHCSLFWWALPFLSVCATCYWAVGVGGKHHLRTLQFIQPVQMAKHFLPVSATVPLSIVMMQLVASADFHCIWWLPNRLLFLWPPPSRLESVLSPFQASSPFIPWSICSMGQYWIPHLWEPCRPHSWAVTINDCPLLLPGMLAVFLPLLSFSPPPPDTSILFCWSFLVYIPPSSFLSSHIAVTQLHTWNNL